MALGCPASSDYYAQKIAGCPTTRSHLRLTARNSAAAPTMLGQIASRKASDLHPAANADSSNSLLGIGLSELTDFHLSIV